MAEEISKYARGTEIAALFKDVMLPDNLGRELNLINFRALYANDFDVPAYCLKTFDENGTECVIAGYLLTDSHKLVIYNPRTKIWKEILYSCSPEKTGELSLAHTAKELRREPSWVARTYPIISKPLAIKEGITIYTSVDKGIKELGLEDESTYYVGCGFFDLPKRKLDEKILERIHTKTLNEDDPDPLVEILKRFPDYGETYKHLSFDKKKEGKIVKFPLRLYAAAHSYPEEHSLHQSFYGKGKEIKPVLRAMEDELKSSTKAVSMNVVNWPD